MKKSIFKSEQEKEQIIKIISKLFFGDENEIADMDYDDFNSLTQQLSISTFYDSMGTIVKDYNKFIKKLTPLISDIKSRLQVGQFEDDDWTTFIFDFSTEPTIYPGVH